MTAAANDTRTSPSQQQPVKLPAHSGEPAQSGMQERPVTPAGSTPTSYPPCICAYLGLGSAECRSAVKGVCAGTKPSWGSTDAATEAAARGTAPDSNLSGAGARRRAARQRSRVLAAEESAAANGSSARAGSGGGVICSDLRPALQVGNASSLISGTALRAIYRQLRDACFPGAITAPSYCNCALDPFSANCALSLTSLCSAGDPLCRLTLEAWEGQARATAVLRTFFSSTCGGQDAGAGADADTGGLDAEGAVDMPPRIGAGTDLVGGNGSGNGTRGGAVVLRLELPGINRTVFQDRYRAALTSRVASAAGAPPGAVAVNSAMELPAAAAAVASTPARPANASSSPEAASPTTSPPRTGTPADAGVTKGAGGRTGAPEAMEGEPGSLSGAGSPASPASPQEGGVGGPTAGGRGRMLQQADADAEADGAVASSSQSPGSVPAALPDSLRVRSLLITLTIATNEPVATEQRLLEALGNGSWLSALQLQLGLPYAVASYTTETYTFKGDAADGADSSRGVGPSGSIRPSAAAPAPLAPSSVSAHGGNAGAGGDSGASGSNAAATDTSGVVRSAQSGAVGDSDNRKTPGGGELHSSGGGVNGGDNSVIGGGSSAAPSSPPGRGTVVPVVVSVVGGALCATAAVVVALLLRRRRQRRGSFDVASVRPLKDGKGGHPSPSSSPHDAGLIASPSQIVSMADGKAATARGGGGGGAGVVNRRRDTPMAPPAPQLTVRCGQRPTSGPAGTGGEAGGFTFPSLTPKAAAAALDATGTGLASSDARRAEPPAAARVSSLPAVPCLRQSRVATGGAPPADALGLQGGAASGEQSPQAPDSPVLWLHPQSAQRSSYSAPEGQEPTLEAARGPVGRGTALGITVALPRSDSGLSGASNVSHVAQMSPSCSVFAGGQLEASREA
ncbi:hypothetical protein PLESTF_001962400 [Pleodorina starrii]|nr:hypothetical protein PLESTM_000040700 [Pleodorina starrii]GLC77605.1 hypothetical protein PLESTF_001962400 [Pleodorina starrii]